MGPSKNEWLPQKWASDKDEPSGQAYRYDPYERTYGSSYSYVPAPGYERTYGRAYRYDPYERTYGRAYSTDKKDDIVTEPKVTLPSKQWKKSDYSEPSRTWKKDDGKYGSKYSSKDEPKHKASKDEPKDHKEPTNEPGVIEEEKEETMSVQPEDESAYRGQAYFFFSQCNQDTVIKQLGESCGVACECIQGCCEGGRCVAKKKDWTNIFLYCPAECVGTIFGNPGTC